MRNFVVGIVVGIVVTRVWLNRYVEKSSKFMQKEKYLIDKLKAEQQKNARAKNNRSGDRSGV